MRFSFFPKKNKKPKEGNDDSTANYQKAPDGTEVAPGSDVPVVNTVPPSPPEKTPPPTNNAATGCCGRFRAELNHPSFAPEEVTGEVIHGPQTFGPAGYLTLSMKTLFMGWSVSILIMDLIETAYQSFYFAYLTNATLLISTIYLSLSWFHTLLSTVLPSVHESTSVSLLHKITWGLYSIAAPGEIVVAVGYWGMDWNGSYTSMLDYRNLTVHGGIIIVLLVEGLGINRVPLRLGHFLYLFLFMSAYVIWTAIHAFVGLGDPASEDDDSIYDVLKWKNDPMNAGLLATFFLLGLGPISFLMVYWMSLPCGCCNATNRRYLKGSDDETVTSYVEMNAVNQYASGPNSDSSLA